MILNHWSLWLSNNKTKSHTIGIMETHSPRLSQTSLVQFTINKWAWTVAILVYTKEKS
jgi:hypothetical protein